MSIPTQLREGDASGGEGLIGAGREQHAIVQTLEARVQSVGGTVEQAITDGAGVVPLEPERFPATIPAQHNRSSHEKDGLPGSDGEHQLQERFGNGARAYAFYDNQMLNHLNRIMQEYIARQTMFFIGTADAQGNCDCSLRAGEEGIMRVIDESTLVYPEYRGNGVMASLGNIIENPHIGVFFGDFYRSTVGLHVNGTASLLAADDVAATLVAGSDLLRSLTTELGRRVDTWVRINVEEAYIHCSKHIPLMKRLDKQLDWGTDDRKLKRGDYFRVRAGRIRALRQRDATLHTE